MNREKSAVSRRNFLKQGAAVGLGLLAGSRVKGSAWAASKERITILSSSVTDTLNPTIIAAASFMGCGSTFTSPW